MQTNDVRRDLAVAAVLRGLLGAGVKAFEQLVNSTLDAMSAARADGYGQGFRDGVESACGKEPDVKGRPEQPDEPPEPPEPVWWKDDEWKDDEVIDWTTARIWSNDEIGSAPRDEDNILADCCRVVRSPY